MDLATVESRGVSTNSNNRLNKIALTKMGAAMSIDALIAGLMSKETLFGLSLFPYLGFLWFLARSQQAPKMMLLGFQLLLVFVAVTIPAGIYAKVHYNAELANVDWLHGSAESFLTLSNIVVVLGLQQAIRQAKDG
jgi:hypothetical protein